MSIGRLRACASGALLSGLLFMSACDDTSTDEGELLVSDSNAVLTVHVVAQADDSVPADEASSVDVKSASGVLVAAAATDHSWIPMSWGEPDADPSTEVLNVTVDIQPDFQDQVLQVELSIDVDGTDATWCEPMRPDPIVPGRYFLPLQPACEERDALTGECVIDSALRCDGYSGTCREDRLTFTFWDGRTTDAGGVCHDQLDDE